MAGRLGYLEQDRQVAGAVNALGQKIGGQFGFKLFRGREIAFQIFGNELVHLRAEDAVKRLREATPTSKRGVKGATMGDTRAAWMLYQEKGREVVANRHEAANGFLVASGLITGTGKRGKATEGFTGSFAPGWKGMDPNTALRDTWLDVIHEPWSNFRLRPFTDAMKMEHLGGYRE